MKILLTSIFFIILSKSSFAQNSGNIVEYETSSGLVLYVNAETLNNYIESNRRFLQRINSCSRGKISFYNPFFGVNDYYNIVGRNNKRECVVEYSHAGISKHRCSLNKYQIDDLSESVFRKLDNKKNIEFMTEYEERVWNSENCIITYYNEIGGSATQEQIDDAVKKNPNLKSVLMLIESEMN